MSKGLLLADEYRKAVEFASERKANLGEAIGAVLTFAQAFSLQAHIHTAISRIGEEVAQSSRRDYGVLIDVILEDCPGTDGRDRVPRFGGVHVIGSGLNAQQAGRKYFQSVRLGGTINGVGTCHLYVWKDPFGMSVVSPKDLGHADVTSFSYRPSDAYGCYVPK